MRVCRWSVCLAILVGGTVFGKEPENLCRNPSFETLSAAGNNQPLHWDMSAHPAQEASVAIDKDAHSGNIALRMCATTAGVARINSESIVARKGIVQFQYKVVKSDQSCRNLTFSVLGMSQSGVEVAQSAAFSAPAEHLGDGQWHQGTVPFDFSERADVVSVLIAPRLNERAAAGEGEWLIDDVECFVEEVGARPVIEALTIPDLTLRVGKTSELVAQISNGGDKELGNSVVRLHLPPEVELAEGSLGVEVNVDDLGPRASRRLLWKIAGKKQANVDLSIEWTGPEVKLTRQRSTVCLATDDPRALYSTADGSWRLMPTVRTLQEGNASPLTALATKKSSELPDSMIGLTAHLPRSMDYEKIFDASHLIDGDWNTSWCGRAHTTPVPGTVDWAQLDFGTERSVKEIRLVPYWRVQGFPVDFEIKARVGDSWTTISEAKGVCPPTSWGQGAKQPYCVTLAQPVTTGAIRIETTRFSVAGFPFCGDGKYMCLSEIEVIDDSGKNVAVVSNNSRVTVSSTYHNLFNTADNIRKTYSMVYDLGVKWNRVGFWGDMTTWGQVERKKGEYTIDPETDKAVTESVDNGVKILYCLCWGNSLYQSRAGADEPPTWRALPFTWEVGPTGEEAMKAYVNYARFVAKHFKGRVKHWEIWNEENSWGWYGCPPDPKAFGILARETAKALKEIDPENYVIFGGSAALAPTFLQDALKEGAGPYLDAVALHPYGMVYPEMACGALDVVDGKQTWKSQQELGVNTFEDMLNLLKSITAKFNPRLDIWPDEWCPVPVREDTPAPCGSGYSELAHAKYTARFFLMGTLQQVPAIYYCMYSNYVWDQGLVRVDMNTRQCYYTTQAMTTLLSGAKPDASLKATVSGGNATAGSVPVRCETLRGRDGEAIVCLWCPVESKDDFPPQTVSVTVNMPQAKNVQAVDTLHVVCQPLAFESDNDQTIVKDVFVGDYPVILRIW